MWPAWRISHVRQAERLGDDLCCNALAWARTIVLSVRRKPSAEEDVFEEILAYALSLTELRSRGMQCNERKDFLRRVRKRTALIRAGLKWGRARRQRRLAAGDCTLSEGGQHANASGLHPSARGRRVNREMFEQFQATTGLSSDVLVGKDDNLACLVFYIAVHAVLSVDGPLDRASALTMLRACRQCRAHFEKLLGSALGECDDRSPAPEARPLLDR